jgi:hypothetical protein
MTTGDQRAATITDPMNVRGVAAVGFASQALATMILMIKQLFRRVSPKLFIFVRIRYRRLRFRFANYGCDFRAKQALCHRYGKRVLAGPFQGMKYPYDVVLSSCVLLRHNDRAKAAMRSEPRFRAKARARVSKIV